MVNDTNYYVVNGWMVTKLKLKGNELHAFALIYGFCQAGGQYTGSINYLADWLGSSRPTAIKTLQNLVEKGFLKKESFIQDKIQLNRYWVEAENIQAAIDGKTIEKEKALSVPTTENAPKKPSLDKIIQHRDQLFNTFAGEDAQLYGLLVDFAEMRIKQKSPMTEKAKQLLLRKLAKEFPGRAEKIATLEQSIERGYKSVYPVREGANPANKQYNYSYGQQGVDFL